MFFAIFILITLIAWTIRSYQQIRKRKIVVRPPAITIDNDEFERNLSATQNYCYEQLQNTGVPSHTSLRSLGLTDIDKLHFILKERTDFNFTETQWIIEPTDDAYIAELFNKQMLFKKARHYPANASALKGRVITVNNFDTVLDGASEVESRGYFDLYDLPPIDTWFYLSANGNDNILFAWVPDAFTDDVQNGIDVNCVDLMQWYEPHTN